MVFDLAEEAHPQAPREGELTVVRDLPHALPDAAVGHVRVDGRVGRRVGASILLHRQCFLPVEVEATVAAAAAAGAIS